MPHQTQHTTALVRQAPKLSGDGDQPLHVNGVIERRIAWNLLEQLTAAGFAVVSVDDGDERVKCAEAMEVMEAIFAVGVAHVLIKKPHHGERWIKLVLGNGEDLISDWGYSSEDDDGLNTFMEEFIVADNW